jgi:hypothetical protein
MRRSTKKLLKKSTSSATILYRKVAGLVMQGLKTFWNNWQWVFALIALLWGIFLFYYKSGTENPARITACEKHLQEHIINSQADIRELKRHINDIDLLVMEVRTALKSIDVDLTIIKNWILDNHQ